MAIIDPATGVQLFTKLPFEVGDYIECEQIDAKPGRIVEMTYGTHVAESKIGSIRTTLYSRIEVKISIPHPTSPVEPAHVTSWLSLDAVPMKKVDPPVPQFASIEEADAWLNGRSENSWTDQLDPDPADR